MGELDCRAIEERLPWLLGGGLSADERRGIEQHLAGCQGCRAALVSSREAGAIYAAHPPSEALVDYALGLPVREVTREVLELHLAHCADCREELRLVASEGSGSAALPSPSDAEPDPVVPTAQITRASRAVPWAGAFALAATLAVASGLSVFVAMRDRPLGPEANVALVELLPESSRTRAGAAREPSIRRSVTTTVVLVTDRAEAFDATRIRLTPAGGGRAYWEASGLAPTLDGAYVVLLPAGAAPEGVLELDLEGWRGGEWSRLGRYRLIVEP